MKRVISLMLLGLLFLAYAAALNSCYMPPTPTPHVGMTQGAGTQDAANLYRNVTLAPGGPTQRPYAQAPDEIGGPRPTLPAPTAVSGVSGFPSAEPQGTPAATSGSPSPMATAAAAAAAPSETANPALQPTALQR